MRKRSFSVILLAIGLFYLAPKALADWSAVKRLTWTSAGSGRPAIAVDSTNAIHVVWEDNLPGKANIFYKKSTDGGTSWGVAKRLTWTSNSSYYPDIAIDSSNRIHVVWRDYGPGNYEVYYKRSTDGGATWSTARRLTWTSGNSYIPDIAIDSVNTIHLVWQDDTPGNYEIYYKKSTDGGTTWSANKRLTWTSEWTFFPAIAIDSTDGVHVIWSDYVPYNNEIFYKNSPDGGASWGWAKRLAWTSGSSTDSALATDSSNTILAVWEDETPGHDEIYYNKSSNAGASWGWAKRLTWTSGSSADPAVAIDSSHAAHVIWHDNTPGNDEIYYRRSPDGGTSWGTVKRLTWNSGTSESPAMAVDSGNTIHVVWSDSTPGNYEIYYKKGT